MVESTHSNQLSMIPARQERSAKAQTRRVLVLANLFPSAVRPLSGVFVKERVRFVGSLPGHEVRVVSPIPRVPPWRFLGHWYDYSQFPREETIDGLPVIRPRHFDLPKLGQFVHTSWMFSSVRRTVGSLRAEFDFDLIDAHFAYPSGVVAAMLGSYFHKPVVITCRGSDILRYPRLPLIRRKICWALKQATQLVAVSNELSSAMQVLGADPDKIEVIPNGVDCDMFRPIEKAEARRMLGLAADYPIVLSVGSLRALKGMHILADAAPLVRRRHPLTQFVIVGGAAPHCDDCKDQIASRIRAHRAERYVRLIGARPHEELPLWYSAADVFVLLSSREGSPNVLMEALACGLPAVTTAVGGMVDTLSDSRLGILIRDRSPSAAAAGICQALEDVRDRQDIRRIIESKSWERTAVAVSAVFDKAICNGVSV